MYIAHTDCSVQACVSDRTRQRYAALDKRFSDSCRTNRLRVLLVLVLTLCGARTSVAQINTLTFDPPVLGKGQSTTATFTLARVLPDITFTLSSSDPANVPVPPSITIPSGTLAVTFVIKTNPVAVPEVVDISVADNIGGVLQAQLMLLTIPAFTVTLNPTRIESGQCALVTFTLAEPAPVGGAVFQPVLSPITIAPIQLIGGIMPAGSTTTTLRIRTFPNTTPTTLHIQFIEDSSNIPLMGWFGGQVLGLIVAAPDLVISPPTLPHNCPEAQGPTFSIADLSLPVGDGTSSLVNEVFPSPVPVQVVFNPHADPNVPASPASSPIDLVQRKGTAFLVGAKVDNVGLVSAHVTVSVQFDGAQAGDTAIMPTCNAGQSLNCFSSDGTATAVINSGFVPPSAGQNLAVTATINPAGPNHISEGDGSTAGHTTPVLPVNVKQTQLKVAYVPLAADFLQPLQSFSFTVSSSDQFTKNVFPVPESDTTAVSVTQPIQVVSIAKDLIAVANAGSRASVGVTRSIGIVPKDYFTHANFGPDVQGITLTWRTDLAGLVLDGNSTGAAHELGHTFGFNNPPFEDEEYKHTLPLPGSPASGFNIVTNQIVGNSYCLMGIRQPIINTWVDQPHFARFFNALKTNPGDPELLTVSAVLHADGSIDPQPSYVVAAGIPTPSAPGDYTVSVLDASGQILSSVSVTARFELNVEPIGPQPTDEVPLFVTVPYTPTAATITVLRNSQTVLRFNIASKLLVDAVASIPDDGFEKNATERRNSLLEKIGALDAQLAAGALNGALEKLRNDIRGHLDEWLIDGYLVSSPLEYTKVEVISLVDELIGRLANK
jgi:hypothetical protein